MELAPTMILVELGPLFVGWAGDVEGRHTCALPLGVLTDEATRDTSAVAMRRQGADCGRCLIGCPVRKLAV